MGDLRPSVGAVVTHLILVKGVPHMRKLRLEKQVACTGGWSSQRAPGSSWWAVQRCSRVGFGRVLRRALAPWHAVVTPRQVHASGTSGFLWAPDLSSRDLPATRPPTP